MKARVLLVWIALSWSPASTADPRILLIGDSHLVGTMGSVLDSRLRALPSSQVATYASCGSHPGWWLNGQPTRCGYWQHDRDGKETSAKSHATPLMKSLLDDLQPQHTVIAQGANLLEGPLGWGEKASRALLEVVSATSTRCIWISPPNARKVSEETQTAFFEMLSRVLPEYGCQLVDSRPFATYPATGGDGLHYDSLGAPGREMSRKWAESVASELEKLIGAPSESSAAPDESLTAPSESPAD